ncbi:hypothetical protein WICMUC_002781 [Wickerhamomyces mucosus]|uniref:FAD dependent oxidoreductase domain-containing protein n=1 Tax=Wickerhamomyces mucosus TaxID=1378264 RepID=A0A9P8TE05_9ASCO|nr:hypothetical protein WICMUC_002781 [Wickerhamomyces mucosus]
MTAGVSGLTSALLLLKQGYSVTIVGKHIPGDIDIEYTSPFAGANWSSSAPYDRPDLQNRDKVAYDIFLKLAEEEPRSGIHQVERITYLRESQKDKNGEFIVPWFIKQKFVKNVRYLNKDELPKDNYKDKIVGGFSYTTVTISTTIYLNYLLQNIYELGGVLRRKSIKHIEDAFSLHHSKLKADLVINATGLNARSLKGVEDEKVYPIRGQILWVRNSATKQVSVSIPDHKQEAMYIFPRKEGGSIIGGTFIPYNSNPNEDRELTKRMIKRAIHYLPELVDPNLGNDTEIDVYRANVGLRPARESGNRIERNGNIIHNYGIGSSGYQSSYGLAQEVVRLTREFFRGSKLALKYGTGSFFSNGSNGWGSLPSIFASVFGGSSLGCSALTASSSDCPSFDSSDFDSSDFDSSDFDSSDFDSSDFDSSDFDSSDFDSSGLDFKDFTPVYFGSWISSSSIETSV